MRILIACVNVCDAAEADFLCIAGYELTADQNPLLIITPDIRRLTAHMETTATAADSFIMRCTAIFQRRFLIGSVFLRLVDDQRVIAFAKTAFSASGAEVGNSFRTVFQPFNAKAAG